MCRWGCYNYESTYMCKFCGTRYCAECLRGDFYGNMKEADHCRKCNQMKCQGKRVEVVVFAPGTEPKAPKKSSKGGKSAGKGKASSAKKGKKKKR